MSSRVTVSDIDVGIPVMGYGQEWDTAAMPSDGSRLAWLGTNNRIYVAKFDCDDKLVGTPVSFPGLDLQDFYADDEGGVVLLTPVLKPIGIAFDKGGTQLLFFTCLRIFSFRCGYLLKKRPNAMRPARPTDHPFLT
jgi:hypothetical protein